MYNFYKLLALLLVLFFLLSCKTKTTKWLQHDNDVYGTRYFDELPKKVRKSLAQNFSLIKEGKYISGTVNGRDTFSVLLKEGGVIISSLYMAKHEVSIAEYMQFYYQTNVVANKPDSLCFLKDFNSYEGRLMSSVYFWHPKYSKLNYPICGVNLKQAIDFCKWKTENINRQLKTLKGGENRRIVFRLPTAYELEYVMSLAAPRNNKVKKLFPFEKIIKTSNTNGIVDENGIILIDSQNDGFVFTSPIKHYKPNAEGLYDIYGNVAEWTITPVYSLADNYKFDKLITNSDTSDWDKELNKITSENNQNYARLLEVIIDTTYYVTKGGSFAHKQYYTQPAAFIPVKQNTNHSWLGFRIVMEIY